MRRFLIVVLMVLPALLSQTGGRPVEAQSGNRWTASYFNNPNWAGNPVQVNYPALISFNWGYGSPGPAVPVDNFTARFQTSAYLYAGMYRFTLTADDEFNLSIDGVTYASTIDAGQSGKSFVLDVPIAVAGYHTVLVDYREFSQTAYVYVDWQYLKPDGIDPVPPYPVPTPIVPAPTPTPVPPSQCSPQSAASVSTEFGDYTPCIRQSQHQSMCFVSSGAWNSPNVGSIETEPQITIWGNCEPDSAASFQVSCDVDVPLEEYKCSKTGAGWFPN